MITYYTVSVVFEPIYEGHIEMIKTTADKRGYFSLIS